MGSGITFSGSGDHKPWDREAGSRLAAFFFKGSGIDPGKIIGTQEFFFVIVSCL